MLISTGDRYINYEEGTLRLPPPKPAPEKPARIKKLVRQPGRRRPMRYVGASKPGAENVVCVKAEAVPGFKTWQANRAMTMARLAPRNKKLEDFGRPDITPRGRKLIWNRAKAKAKVDMEKINTKMDLDSRAAEALEKTLVLMRSPLSPEMQLKAARQVLDFTMAKPVQKSEVTVNSAEKWLEDLGADAE